MENILISLSGLSSLFVASQRKLPVITLDKRDISNGTQTAARIANHLNLGAPYIQVAIERESLEEKISDSDLAVFKIKILKLVGYLTKRKMSLESLGDEGYIFNIYFEQN